jgi:hypothetical protein
MLTLKEEYKKKINDFRNEVEGMIRHRFMDDKIIHPVVFGLVIQKDKLIMTVLGGLGELFGSDAGKDRAVEIVRSMNKEIKPVALCFVSEGWMSTHNVEEMNSVVGTDGKYLDNAVRPANDPNRKEVLMMMFETFDEQCSVLVEIKRIGELVELEEFKKSDWEEKKAQVGRFGNMIEDNYSELNQLLEKTLNKKESQN